MLKITAIDQEMLNRIKSESTKMLVYFDAFCKQYGIEYSLSCGTELGAIRHGGYIPWDDDIDIDMHLDEFRKFEKAWNQFGDKANFFLQTKQTDPFVSTNIPRLRKNNTTRIPPGCEHIPIHWGLFLDIFLLFNTPKCLITRGIQILLYKASNICCLFAWNHVNASKLLLTIFQFFSQLLFKGVCFISDHSRKSGILYYPDGYPKKRIGKKTVFFPAKPIMFEGFNLMGHADPNAYLTWQYGDYMTPPPEDKRGGHWVSIIDLDNDYSKYTGRRIHNANNEQ